MAKARGRKESCESSCMKAENSNRSTYSQATVPNVELELAIDDPFSSELARGFSPSLGDTDGEA